MRNRGSRIPRLLASVALLGLAGLGWAAEPPAGLGSPGQKPLLVIDSGGHTAVIRKILFSHDGRYLVSAGDDKAVRIWSVESGEVVRTLRGQIQPGSEGKIFAAALSPDDRYLAVGGFLTSEGDIRLHDFQTGEVVAVFHGHENVVHALAFSPDGRELASGSADRTVRLWDVASRKLLRVLTPHGGSVSTVAFSPDGARVLSGSFDSVLRLWDAKNGGLIQEMRGHTDHVRAAVFSRDGRFIASGGNDSSVRLWSGSSGDFVIKLGQGDDPVLGLEFTPDGRLLAGNVQGFNSATLLSVPGGKRLGRFEHDNTLTALAISTDGKLAATAGGDAQEIYIWDLAKAAKDSKAAVIRLAGRGRPVWSVGFAPDSRSIAFGTTSWPKDATDRGPQLNDRGPLEQIFVLDRDEGLGVLLGGKVTNEAAFLRARNRFGTSQLKTKSGGNDPVLQVIRAGRVLEIKRGSTSGYDHRCFTWTPDGKQIVSGGAGGFLALYDGKTGREVRRLVGHTSEVFAVAVSADGRRLVSGSYDQTVRLWDLATGTNLLMVFVATDGEWVAWTPHGYYTSSLHGDLYFGWHVNQGAAHAADYYSAAQFDRQLYRPDVVAEYLKDGDIQKALARANASRKPGAAPAPAVASIKAILPPRIDVPESLRDGLEVEKEDLSIKAAVLSNNLPITDLRVTVNGIQVAGGSTVGTKGEPLQREIEVEVTLRPGDNVLTFQASHAKARSQLVRHVKYRPPPGVSPAKPAKPNLILLAVGISDYADLPLRLHWADADARKVFESFKRQEGKLFGHVEARLLAAGTGASRSEILAALHWFEGRGAAGDLRILFLSGHGALDAHRNFYFLSQDQAADKNPELAGVGWSQFLDSLTAGPGLPILMVDACHAAAAANGPARARADLTEVIKSYKSVYRNIVAFTASTSTEPSLEREDWGGGHGAFTAALLEGLAGKADGFVGGEKDGKVDTLELSAWLIKTVPKLTESQQHALFDSGETPPFPLFQVEP